jgi:hypothetical protein
VSGIVGSTIAGAFMQATFVAPRTAPMHPSAGAQGGGAWLPLLLAMLVTGLLLAAVLAPGRRRSRRRLLPFATRRTLKAVSWRFADAVERGDVEQAEAEVAQLFKRSA